MFNKNQVKSIDGCLIESYTVNTLKNIAEFIQKASGWFGGVLGAYGVIYAIAVSNAIGTYTIFGQPAVNSRGDFHFGIFFGLIFTYLLYGLGVVFISVIIQNVLLGLANLIYSNEVSAKIKLLEYIEAHSEEQEPRRQAPAPVRQVVKEEKPKKKTVLNKSNVVETDIHTPYWCDSCGYAGPYEGACPKCYSGVRRYNPNYKE